MWHVDYKKWSCHPVEFKKMPCRHVDFKKVPCHMSLRPKRAVSPCRFEGSTPQCIFPPGNDAIHACNVCGNLPVLLCSMERH